MIKDEGFNLLDMINKETTNEMTDINDIVITFDSLLDDFSFSNTFRNILI